MNLKVNTAPVLEYAGIGKTTVGPDEYYVLIFHAKDMDTMIGTQHVHKDINIMNVTAGGVSRPPITLSVTGSDFATGGDLLAAVSQLDTAHLLPTGNGLLRLKTDVKVGGPEKVYEVCIKDEQGLSSEVIRASTQKNKLSDVKLFDGPAEIGETSISVGATESSPKEFPGINGKTLTAQAAPAGAAITGSIAKRNSDGTWTQISGGTVSGTTTAAVNLPALAAGETEALYKITLKASLTGYDDSNSKDFFVKLVRQEVPVLKLKQDFSQNDDVSLYCISAGTTAHVKEDIIQYAGNYDNPAKALVIYNMGNGQCKLDLSASAGATVKYKLDTTSSITPTTTAIITVPSGAHTLEVWAVKGTIEGPHTIVYINVVNFVGSYDELKNIVKNAPEKGSGDGQYNYNNFINIKIGTNLTASSADTEIAVTGGKKLKLIPKSGSPIHTINAGGNGRIFKVSGSSTVLHLQNIKLEGGYDADGKGGAVHVETGGKLVLKGQTVITPSAGGGENTPGKNDVYLVSGASIRVDGALTATAPIVARITPQNYSETTHVLTGTFLSTNYTKFSVTQQDDGFLWTIKNNGSLQKISAVINGSDSGAWKKLKDAVQNFPAGSTITIKGEITATSDSGNSGEIVIDKNLTIKGKSGASSDILNANSSVLDTNAHRIFKVEPGKKLTLENLTLKGGKNNETDTGGPPNPKGKGGAIYSKGELEIRNVLITGCEAKYSGGGIYCSMSGSSDADERKLVIENTEVTSCKAPEPNYGTGGGVYIVGNNCLMNVKLSDVKIKNNEASFSAAGLCLHGSHGAKTTADSVVLTRVTLHENKLTDTGARGGAGMVFATYDRDSAITLKNCTVTKNESTTSGGGISLHTSSSSLVCGKLILEDSSVTENKAQNGGGVYVDWSNLVIKNSVLTSNTATDEGGGVYVAKGTFEMEGSATVTHSAEAHKNDVYLDYNSNQAKITVADTLSPEGGIAARITVADSQYSISTQVLTAGSGVALANEHTKFTVTPKNLAGGNTQQWEISSTGFLKKTPVVIDGSGFAWKKLRAAVEAAEAGDVITIDGEIKATKDTDNSDVIDITKNITIQGKTGANKDILNANSSDSYYAPTTKHRIFKVQNGTKLTLKNLTLKDGEATLGTGGGAIYLLSGSSEAELEGCIIEACKANKGGAIGCNKNSTVKLTNTTIKNCTAHTGGNAGLGGAIYAEGATVTMTGCTLTGNKADKGGGAIYAVKNGSTRSNVTIEGGTIGGTGDDANETIDSSGMGGGIYIGANTTVTLQNDAQIIGNTAKNGGGVYVAANDSIFKIKDSSRVIPSTGDEANVAGKNDVYLDDQGSGGAKITVVGSLTPQDGIAARITVEAGRYMITTQVLNGTSILLSSEHGKFTVTQKIVVDVIQKWKINDAGKLELFNAEVPYNKLAHYLSNYALGDDIINHIEITGTIPANDLKGTFGLPPSPGALGQLLKNNAPKKVALKLPSGLSVTSMAYCFYGCKNLTTGPDIPSSVTDMRYCFRNCTGLQSVKINRGYAGCNFDNTFEHCTALQDGGIKVPLTHLGTYKANAGTMGTTEEKFSAIP